MCWYQESRSSEKDPLSELNKYLSDNLEQTHNVVAWWGMNQHRYPTMACIALDYLPIQGSTVPLLQILKDGYKSGRVISNPAEPVAVGGELDQEEMDFLMQFTPQVLAAP
ncbi:hypothetical protein FRC03_001709 [Tulasnella sp. 419]|nr:hypothetical protein FRC03_001709 [Tulasnella sp. 419]